MSGFARAACGGSETGTERFDCADCGRALASCASCDWLIRLFSASDPRDCLNCGYGWEQDKTESAGLEQALHNSIEAYQQLTQHAGPIYEQARARSKVMHAAWQVAGSPARISAVRMPDGERRYVRATDLRLRRYDRPVPQSEVERWYAWERQRRRLRTQLGWD